MNFLLDDTMDKDMRIASLKCNIACEKAMVEFNMVEATLSSFMEEGEEETKPEEKPETSANTETETVDKAKQSKFVETIRKIFSAIRTFLTDAISAIAKKLGRVEQREKDAKQIKLSYDLAAIYSATEGDFNEGMRIIEMMAEANRAPRFELKDIERFLIKNRNQARYVLTSVISTSMAFKWYNRYCTDGAIRPFKQKLDIADKLVAKIDKPKYQKQALKVAMAMRYSVQDYIGAVNACVGEMSRQLPDK